MQVKTFPRQHSCVFISAPSGKELLKHFEIIQEMTGDDKNIVLKFLDLTIRDHKT